jgi:hypothetical protein
MDFLFLGLFLVFAGFFVVLGSWRRVAVISFVGVAFLVISSMFILTTGIETINGSTQTWVGYSEFANDTVTCVNCNASVTPTPIVYTCESTYPACGGTCAVGACMLNGTNSSCYCGFQ